MNVSVLTTHTHRGVVMLMDVTMDKNVIELRYNQTYNFFTDEDGFMIENIYDYAPPWAIELFLGDMDKWVKGKGWDMVEPWELLISTNTILRIYHES